MSRTPECWLETLSGLPPINAAYAILADLPGYDWNSPERISTVANLSAAIEALTMIGAGKGVVR
jgi:hypothetical protein